MPSSARLPTPWEAVCLSCQGLLRLDRWLMAAAALPCVMFYFRPSEALVSPLLGVAGDGRPFSPSGARKTEQKQAMGRRGSGRPSGPPLLRAGLAPITHTGRSGEQKGSPFSGEEWRRVCKDAGLRLKVLGPPTLDCLRHASASLDIAPGRRCMEAGTGLWRRPCGLVRKRRACRSRCCSVPTRSSAWRTRPALAHRQDHVLAMLCSPPLTTRSRSLQALVRFTLHGATL